MYLKLCYEHVCVDRKHSDEDFGNWHEDYSFYLESRAILTNEQDYDTVPLTFDAKAGDTVYLIYALWGTGNSFGRADSSSVDFIAVFKTFDKANEVLNELKKAKHYEDFVNITEENGETRKYSPDWTGYFESLEQLDIVPIVITA